MKLWQLSLFACLLAVPPGALSEEPAESANGVVLVPFREPLPLVPLSSKPVVKARPQVHWGGRTGYDSNTLLRPDHEIGDWVFLADVGLVYHPFLDETGRGPYFGLEAEGTLLSYDSKRLENGGNNLEADLAAYAGIRGAKTNLRVDVNYRLQNADTLDYSNLDREAPRSDSNDWNVAVSGERQLPRGRLEAATTYDRVDFTTDSGLNDVTAVLWDGAWFFDPAFAPKTSLGFGLHGGSFDTEDNFDQQFIEPSLRADYNLSPKTTLRARLGADFVSYRGPEAIGQNVITTFSAGGRWRMTPKTFFGFEVYRDFSPSLAADYENFVVSGFRLNMGQRLPGRWSLDATLAYEEADYFSTIQGIRSDRKDRYLRPGVTVSRPLDILDDINCDFSIFSYLNCNESNVASAQFNQLFSGFGLRFVY